MKKDGVTLQSAPHSNHFDIKQALKPCSQHNENLGQSGPDSDSGTGNTSAPAIGTNGYPGQYPQHGQFPNSNQIQGYLPTPPGYPSFGAYPGPYHPPYPPYPHPFPYSALLRSSKDRFSRSWRSIPMIYLLDSFTIGKMIRNILKSYGLPPNTQ